MLYRAPYTVTREFNGTFYAFGVTDCEAVFAVDEQWAGRDLINIGEARLLTWNPPGGEERLPRAFAVKLMGEDDVRREEARITEEIRDRPPGWLFHRRTA